MTRLLLLLSKLSKNGSIGAHDKGNVAVINFFVVAIDLTIE